MRVLMVLFLLVLFLPHKAGAGAWMREKGTAFMSFGATFKEGAKIPEQNYFLEFGAGKKLTLGASLTAPPAGTTDGHVFLRFPIGSPDKPSRMSAELGLGLQVDAGGEFPFLRTALSWGKGLQWRGKNGWINLDAAVQWSMGERDHQMKLDTTLGLTLTDRFKVLGQTFLYADPSGASLTLSPGLVARIGKNGGKRKRHLHIAFDQKIGGDEKAALRIGLWQEF